MVARKVVPNALIKALPNAAAYSKVKFASVVAEHEGRATITTEWPKKVGS